MDEDLFDDIKFFIVLMFIISNECWNNLEFWEQYVKKTYLQIEKSKSINFCKKDSKKKSGGLKILTFSLTFIPTTTN